MNEMKRIKSESYSADMSLREQAIHDKEKVKRKHSIKRKYKGVIKCLKLEVYGDTAQKCKNMGAEICRTKKISESEFTYIGLI